VSASSFTVEAIVSNAVNLADAEYRLTYDPAIVDVPEILIAAFLGQSGRATGQFDPAKAVRMLAPGFIGFLGYSYTDVPGENVPGVNGQGVLATLNVTPRTVGTTELSLEHNLMFDAQYNLLIPVTSGTVVTVADCITGDLNCDGAVNIIDIVLVAARFGTSQANPDPDGNVNTPNYNALYDLDGDRLIEIADIQTIAALWRSVL
jgi:hypothetical protein